MTHGFSALKEMEIFMIIEHLVQVKDILGKIIDPYKQIKEYNYAINYL
jgi:hypothetical protein